jgi:DHA2 family multidrug resistance protein
LTPANPNFHATVTQLTTSIQHLGATAAAAMPKALGQTYLAQIAQASFLAYRDVYLYGALLAFAFAPFTLLFSPLKKAAQPGAGAH